MIENYIYKTESNPDTFWYEDRKIGLREYQKDLVFYWSGEEDKAEYALYDKSPKCEKLPTICADGKFGSFSKVKSPLVFDGRNFENLTDNIHLSFLISANKVNGFYTMYLKPTEDFKIDGGDYSFTVQVDGEISRQINLKLKAGSSFSTLKNKLAFELDPSLYGVEVDLEQTNSEILVIKSAVSGKTFKISDGTDGINLLSLLTVEKENHGMIPSSDSVNIMSFVSETGSLIISHCKVTEENIITSKLRFSYKEGEVSKTTSIEWDSNGLGFDHVEVDIDSSVMYVFLNGELKKAVLLAPLVRTFGKTEFIINGNEEDYYSIEEVIIKSKLQNKENFQIPVSQLTKYDTTIPYIDFHYSGKNILANSLTELVANCSDGISLVLNYDGLFYYYQNGSWRNSDGSYTKSNDSYTFSDYIKDFTFTGKDDMFIRAYFESDGDTLQYIEDLYFTLSEDSIFGDGSTTPAILVGEKEFPDETNTDADGNEVSKPQIIELKDKTLIIKTDQGTTEIKFPKNMTLDEVIDFIKSMYPEGIVSVYRDAADRIVLVSETKGDEAYIIVSGDAADILFGKKKSEQGSDQTKNTLEQNYDKFIEEVKKYSSNDLIPIEIKDDQIRLYLQEAINLYKKYRNDELNLYKIQLSGNATDGYELPVVIEDWHDITDIIFKPLFPIGFYTGAFDNDAEDIITLSLVNSMGGVNYSQFYGKGFQTDYYLSLMNISSMEQILGLAPTWKVYNNRLFIFPNQISKYTNVIIEYKAPIDPIKAMRDPYIIQYVYGKIRMAQGEVRSQYGSQLSVSSIQMQFNGDTMYQRGEQAVKEALEGMMKNQEPLGFIMG